MGFGEQYGPWALITGASAGFGELFARELAAKGLNLVLLARRLERLEKLGEELSAEYGIEYRAIGADLSAPDFLPGVAEATADLEIGLLINNAGFTNTGDFLDNKLEDEIRLVDVNCRAAMIMAHHFGRPMRERKRGGIIFSASIAGFGAIPIWANYAASKGYDLLLGEALGAELAKDHVDVLSMCPGATHTEFATFDGPIARLTVMHPEPVVRGALQALGRRRTWIAGPFNRFNVFMYRLLPRSVGRQLAGYFIRDVVSH